MNNSFRYLLLYFYIIFNAINRIRTAPNGYLLAASYNPASASNALYKIDPLTGKFTVFTLLTNYKAYDVTYDFINKILYVFGSEATLSRESSQSVMVVNPFNATKQYRTITTELDAEIFGLRVDSSTGKLYSLQMSDALENPTSIVQIDPSNFIAKRWVNITKANGVQPNSMAFFFNSTDHQYFVTVPYSSNDYLVGIDVIKRKIISEISNSNLPSYLCYDNKTNAFYGMQEVQGKRACRLVRLNPYNGTIEILSHDFNDYLSSTGTCYGGFYFRMIVQKLNTQNILTFDLNNNGKIIANNPAEDYLDAFAFVPI
jgi:DNA-binding beta-propeller fold protein YncE